MKTNRLAVKSREVACCRYATGSQGARRFSFPSTCAHEGTKYAKIFLATLFSGVWNCRCTWDWRGFARRVFNCVDFFGYRAGNTPQVDGSNSGNKRRMAGSSRTNAATYFPANVQVPNESKGRPVRNKNRINSRIPARNSVRTKVKAKTMPVACLNPNSKIAPSFVYPNNGKAMIYLEASNPVDIFVANPTQAATIMTVEQAAGLGILCFPQKTFLNEIVDIPPAWKEKGWILVIGNPGTWHVAVYYALFNT
jgi:hypothetical protein